ncbi:MAG: hypothetical protein OHK0039_19080 [Bacteroidia bacterium]
MWPRLFACALLVLALWSVPVTAQEAAVVVPQHLSFCGMDLVLTPAARAKVQTFVQSYRQSPRYFQQMVQRSHLYMPFIEEAFADAGIPEDLKYLAIQESSLRPAVVSSSQAVGFWQFKADAAREYGLLVSDEVDERMHIFRASQAAAQYFIKANYDFDNWIYAIIAYNEGPTGAVRHSDPAYYGVSAMTIEGDLHEYALKAIAHKIAYGQQIAQRGQPELFLQPRATRGEANVRQLFTDAGIDEEQFFAYNAWILDRKKLPRDRVFTYYLPMPGDQYTGHLPDPVKASQPVAGVVEPQVQAPAPAPTVVSIAPPPADPAPEAHPTTGQQLLAQPTDGLSEGTYVQFILERDIHYKHEYVTYDRSEPLTALATRYQMRYTDLLTWNRLLPGADLEPGTLIYLVKPAKASFHVVQAGESLADIADFHGTSVRKLQRNNRMKSNDYYLFIGQKLYVGLKRPKGEKLIILQPKQASVTLHDQPQRPRVAEPVVATASQTQATAIVQTRETQTYTEVQTRWITHTVARGETLWQISRIYDTKVEIIKRVNDLTSDLIHEGQQLKVLAKEHTLPVTNGRGEP